MRTIEVKHTFFLEMNPLHIQAPATATTLLFI